MIRVKISQTVLDDEYTIFGSELSNNNSGMTIRIFGSKISNYSCLRLSSLPKLLNDYEPERYSDGIELSRKLIELYDKRNLLSSLDSEPIFKRLVNAYKRNLIDESLHTGVKFIESDIVKNLPKKSGFYSLISIPKNKEKKLKNGIFHEKILRKAIKAPFTQSKHSFAHKKGTFTHL